MGFFDFGKKKQKQVKTPSQYQIVTKNDIDSITKIINKDFPIISKLLKKHIKGFAVSNKKEYFYKESKEYPGYMEFRYKIDLGSVNIYKFCEDWDDFIFGPFEEFENDLENKLKYDAVSYTHHVSPQNDLVSLSCNDGPDENGNYPFSFGCYKAYVKIESSVSESLNNIKDILTDLSIFEEEYDILDEGPIGWTFRQIGKAAYMKMCMGQGKGALSVNINIERDVINKISKLSDEKIASYLASYFNYSDNSICLCLVALNECLSSLRAYNEVFGKPYTKNNASEIAPKCEKKKENLMKEFRKLLNYFENKKNPKSYEIVKKNLDRTLKLEKDTYESSLELLNDFKNGFKNKEEAEKNMQ